MAVVYVKHKELKDEYTTISFVSSKESVKVNRIDTGYITLVGSKSAVNELIAAQDARIEVVIISKEQFLEEMKDSHILRVIDEATGLRIRERYTVEQELSMLHKKSDDPEKIEYLAFREEQLEVGRAQKNELGL